MARNARRGGALLGVLLLGACSSSSSGAGGKGPSGSAGADGGSPAAGAGATDGGAGPGASPAPPLTLNHWTFYGAAQGLSQDVHDVSADEGGNVYVAGTDAVYAKTRTDARFLRFDAESAGLTLSCHAGVPPEDDPAFRAALDGKLHPQPPGPPAACPVISVAGAAAGTAAIGFKGHGTDGDGDADWAQESGGMDVVRFDGAKLQRARHVFIASPPHSVCGVTGEGHTDKCPDPADYFWVSGRRKLRQVMRIAVNHDHSSPAYGDIWMGGTHATLAALLHEAPARGWHDRTQGQPAKWADAQYVWEHAHPAFYSQSLNEFLTNEAHAVAIDPRSGTPWGSNAFRTGYLAGYPDLTSDGWWLEPLNAASPSWIDVWPDIGDDPWGPSFDAIESLSFCDDGTLWFGSARHGLARRDPNGALSTFGLPDYALHSDNVYAVACDPSDGSVWIGLGWGGLMRFKDGAFTQLDPNDPSLPALVRQPVRSIQIDRWSSPRIVYFAFLASTDAAGKVRSGGVASYDGP